MSAVELPFKPSVGRYSFITAIEGIEYLFNVEWNTVNSSWYASIYDPTTNAPIAINIRLVLGTYFARYSMHPLFRDGAMMAVDFTDKGRDATFDDLGKRVLIEYIPVLELIQRWKDLG